MIGFKAFTFDGKRTGQKALADQSSLSGVLNTLHDLHLPVLSAQSLGDGEEGEDAEPLLGDSGRREG